MEALTSLTHQSTEWILPHCTLGLKDQGVVVEDLEGGSFQRYNRDALLDCNTATHGRGSMKGQSFYHTERLYFRAWCASMRGARVAEGGDFVLHCADAGEAVRAVPRCALHEQRAVGVVAHVILVHAPHGLHDIVPEHLGAWAPLPWIVAWTRVCQVGFCAADTWALRVLIDIPSATAHAWHVASSWCARCLPDTLVVGVFRVI